MKCPRCHGLMVQDMCWDLEETQGMWIHTSRCMNCGHLTDPQMDKHRQQGATAAPSRTVPSEGHSLQAMGEV
jgi:uncharacterized Zn finger protein